jgi:CheY-like chemotaxis protein
MSGPCTQADTPCCPPPRPARVLVVDDEPGIAELLQDVLEAAGHAVTTASSGAEALQCLQAEPFDLIVSDLRMPDIDGAALWREVRVRHPALARRVLFVTGDTLSPAAERFVAETGCPSLDKPFSRNDLMRRVQALLKARSIEAAPAPRLAATNETVARHARSRPETLPRHRRGQAAPTLQPLAKDPAMTPLRARPFDRHAVTRRHAGLDFSLLLPLGWTLDAPAQDAPPAAGAWVELARARSPGSAAGEAARVVVSGCQRSEAPSLEDALNALLRRQGLGAAPATLRPLCLGRHEGLSATLQARHRGRPLTLRLALLEDGLRLLRLVLSAPAGHEALDPHTWATLAGGLVLDEARGPQLPLRSPVADWWARAQAAESAGRLSEAEDIVRRVLPSAGCAVQTARLYVQRARRLAAAGDREGARQARDLAQGWTALHTGLGRAANDGAETFETHAAVR